MFPNDPLVKTMNWKTNTIRKKDSLINSLRKLSKGKWDNMNDQLQVDQYLIYIYIIYLILYNIFINIIIILWEAHQLISDLKIT